TKRTSILDQEFVNLDWLRFPTDKRTTWRRHRWRYSDGVREVIGESIAPFRRVIIRVASVLKSSVFFLLSPRVPSCGPSPCNRRPKPRTSCVEIRVAALGQ